MKNALAQSTQLAVIQRSAMPIGASASVRTRAFDPAATTGAHAGIGACAAATPCDNAAVAAMATHRGPHAWRPPVC